MLLPRYDSNRATLEAMIPLSVPLSIYVDPSSVCNFQCSFCPTGDRALIRTIPKRRPKIMDFNLFKKVVDDLHQFNKSVKALHLYIDGEPLLNPRFVDMVKYAKQSGYVEKINTTTNASCLSPELNLKIIDAGIDRISISVHSINSEQYFRLTKYQIDFDQLAANIRHLYEHRGKCKIIIKINGDLISKEDEKKFFEIFEPIATGVNVEHVMSCWPEFDIEQKGLKANKSLGIYGQPIREVRVCPYVFFSFAIHPDGTASACFLDWERKLIIGDACIQSVKEIWNGARLREHQLMMLRGERKSHSVCGNCGQMTHGVVETDNIDATREKLLKKFQ